MIKLSGSSKSAAAFIFSFIPSIILKYKEFFAGLLIVLTFSGLFSFVTYKTGPLINNRFGHDVILLYDGIYRILEGQVPTVDFHFVLGPLFFYLFIPWFKILGITSWAFVQTSITLGILFGCWAYFISFQRMHLLPSLIFTFIVSLMIFGTYHLGHEYSAVTYANLYNRFSYAILFIVLVELLVPLPETSKNLEKYGGVSTGILIAALFFIKITFFLVAVAGVLMKFILTRVTRKWILSVLFGFLTVSILILFLIDFNLTGLISDYLISNNVRGNVLFDSKYIQKKFEPHELQIFLSFFPLIFVKSSVVFKEAKIPIKISILFLYVFIIILGIFLNLTNLGFVDMPMLTFLFAISLEYILRSFQSNKVKQILLFLSMIIFCYPVYGPLMQKNLDSMIFAYFDKKKSLNTLTKFNSKNLSSCYIRGADGYFNEKYVEKINDGIQILKSFSKVDDKIFTLTFENPFPVAMGYPGPKNVMLCYHYQNTFDEYYFTEPKTNFIDISLIMIPVQLDPESTITLWRVYRDYINFHYKKIADTEYWRLYRHC